jgi:Immunity protein 21
MTSSIRWIGTLGGPWIFCPVEEKSKWGGGVRDSVLGNCKNDYEGLCACMTDQNGRGTYTAVVGDNRQWMGIGEMAQQIAVLNLKSAGLSIVEWIGADDDDSKLAELLEAAEHAMLLNDVELNIAQPNYELFDSVWSGLEEAESIEVSMRPGIYRAVSQILKIPNGEFAVTSFVSQNQG